MSFIDKAKGRMAEATEAASSAIDVAGSALVKVNELIDDYKKALDVLARFGFTVGTFDVTMGLLPEVKTSIVGNIAEIRTAELAAIAEEQAGNKLVVAILNAIIAAKGFYDRLKLKSPAVVVDVKLGLPPSVGVHFGTA